MIAPKPRPWLFALTGVPYGVGGAFVSYVMPYLADHSNFKMPEIGWYTTLLFVPTFFQFLYAPVVDLGPARRHWLVIFAGLGGLSFAIALMQDLHTHLSLFLLFAFLGQLLSGLTGSCNGALMATTIPDERRGTAGAAYNVGNLSGGALYAATIIFLTSIDANPIFAFAATMAIAILPSLAIVWMHEPPRVAQTQLFRTMLRDVGHVLFSKSGITGILLCISPVGTAALAQSFTAMREFGARGWLVATINGPANAILSAAGAAIGGWLCDRTSRRGIYLLSGGLTAVVGVAMLLGPRTELAYAVGVSAYYLVMGLCFASFTATVLETIGHGDAAAGTKYTLFTAAGNVAIAYVNLINTRFFDPDAGTGSVDGLFMSDATLNFAGVVVLGFVFWRLGSFGKTKHPTETLAS